MRLVLPRVLQRVVRAVSRAGAKDVSTLARHGAFMRT